MYRGFEWLGDCRAVEQKELPSMPAEGLVCDLGILGLSCDRIRYRELYSACGGRCKVGFRSPGDRLLEGEDCDRLARCWVGFVVIAGLR